MKRFSKSLALILVLLMVLSLAACAKPAPAAAAPAEPAAPENTKLVVGYAQLGAESGWRTAETESIQAEAAKLGVDLKFTDAQGKQENQIKSIRTFIQQKVDVIGLAPAVETGWDAVFKEAKDAGIPIVLVDRSVKVNDDSLYATFIGSDFILEGKNAAIEMARLLGDKGNVYELEGSVGASAATDRKKGFDDEMAANHPNIKIIKSQTGEFTRAKGQEVMESWLKSDKGNINGLYAHNDDMALGAIQAIEAAGLKPSVDIKIVSVDGVKGIFEAMAAGKANVTIECNPQLGPQFFKACQDLKDGKTLEKWIKSDEGIFRSETAKTDLPNRKY